METILLLQIVISVAGFALLWRRIDALRGDVARLRDALEALEARRAAPQRAQRGGAAAAAVAPIISSTPHARAARAWGLARERGATSGVRAPSRETLQGVALALGAVSPAMGIFFGAGLATVSTLGLVVSTVMLALAIRAEWRAAAWAGVITASAWALVHAVMPLEPASTASYAGGLAVSGIAGLVFALLRPGAPGPAMALVMGFAALALADKGAMAGPAGLALGAIVAAAALVGAASLRLEAVHIAAFVAGLIGLFVLSGQPGAAIWFTPAATWAGALFLAIAVVRAPQLGARGAALAATGVLMPLGAIAALYAAQHGLADRFAAGSAFAALAAALAAILVAATGRRRRGLEALGLTLWVLACGAFLSGAAAIIIMAPAPASSAAFAAYGAALLALNAKWPHAAWRALAGAAVPLTAIFALATVDAFMTETDAWPPWALIALGLITPAAFSLIASRLAWRAQAPAPAATFELLALLLTIAALHTVVRLAFAGEAVLLRPVSFVESGAQIGIWLAAALIAANGVRSGARIAAALALAIAALTASIVAAFLWLTPFWQERADGYASLQPLGFLVPALLFGVHWAFWRARGSSLRTRVAFGACAVLMAAFLTLWTSQSQELPEWLGALVGAFAFAGAVVINFAPGVTLSPARGYLRR